MDPLDERDRPIRPTSSGRPIGSPVPPVGGSPLMENPATPGSTRPKFHPPSDRGDMQDNEDPNPDPALDLENSADPEEPDDLETQPFEDDGVHQDMATATYDRGWAQSPQQLGRNPGAVGASEHARASLAGEEGVREEVLDENSDAAIMLRVREGDDSGFTYLIEKYRRQMIHYMFRMTANQAVAEELAQEVFLRVYRSRESYRAEAKFTTWLYRIATNLGVNYARDHKHEKAGQNIYLDQPDAETGSTPDVADSRLTVEQTMMRDERLSGIRAQVMALPERQRQAVLMHKYQEMDYREIGAVLKLSESATKSLLFRAYQTLRERLKDYV
jgi:RNA polymerase sigma-70 factor (ECF subfamily)